MARKKPIISPLGQWAYPGEVTIIPSSNITMKGVNYPVLGVDNLGNSKVMMPGAEYNFPGDYVTEIPQMGKGGLRQWFAEDWTDIKTGKPCGRSGKEKGSRPYPACRPKNRVNETTPKTTSEMSSAEKAKFKREKTSGKRIDYNHKRRQDGGESYKLPNLLNISVYQEPSYKESDQYNRTGYNPGTGTIYYNPNNSWENIKNPIWLEHERFHHLQHLNQTDHIGSPMSIPPMIASDALMSNYYNRRNLDLNKHVNNIIQKNPQLQFVPKEKLIFGSIPNSKGLKAFLGAEDLMYSDPNTIEGEARKYEDYITNGGKSLFNNGGETWLDQYQAGGRPIYTSNPNDPRLRSYNDSLSLYNQYLKPSEINKTLKEIKNDSRFRYYRPSTTTELNSFPGKIKPILGTEFDFSRIDADLISGRSTKHNYYPAYDSSGRIIPGEIGTHLAFKKPVQPVYYKKPEVAPKVVEPVPVVEPPKPSLFVSNIDRDMYTPGGGMAREYNIGVTLQDGNRKSFRTEKEFQDWKAANNLDISKAKVTEGRGYSYDYPENKKYGGWLNKYQSGGNILLMGDYDLIMAPKKDNYLLPDINRPSYKDEFGNRRSEYKMGFNIDGKETLIPSVVGGKQLTDDQALERYYKTGLHMGQYNTPEEADYAARLRTARYNMLEDPIRFKADQFQTGGWANWKPNVDKPYMRTSPAGNAGYSDNTRVVTQNTNVSAANRKAAEAAEYAKRVGSISQGRTKSDYEKAREASSLVAQAEQRKGSADPLDYVLDMVNPATYGFAGADLIGNTAMGVNNLAKGNFSDAAGNAFDAGMNALYILPAAAELRGPLRSAGKYLTTQTPLKNTYKYNPWAFKADPEAYYHRSPNLNNIINQETGMLQGFGESEAGKLYSELAQPGAGPQVIKNAGTSNEYVSRLNLMKPANSRLYFSKGVPLDYGRTNMILDKTTGRMIPGQGYVGPYIAEVKGVPMGSSTKGRAPGLEPTKIGSYAVSRRPISLDEVKFYKEDWLRGYKPIDVPNAQSISKPVNYFDNFDNLTYENTRDLYESIPHPYYKEPVQEAVDLWQDYKYISPELDNAFTVKLNSQIPVTRYLKEKPQFDAEGYLISSKPTSFAVGPGNKNFGEHRIFTNIPENTMVAPISKGASNTTLQAERELLLPSNTKYRRVNSRVNPETGLDDYYIEIISKKQGGQTDWLKKYK